MKRLLLGVVFGLVMVAQPYGRPGYGGGGYSDGRGIRGNGFAERITREERMGLITPREARKLWDMERHLRYETEKAYRSGYGISPREQNRLAEMSARLDREISRQMRDDDRMPPRGCW